MAETVDNKTDEVTTTSSSKQPEFVAVSTDTLHPDALVRVGAANNIEDAAKILSQKTTTPTLLPATSFLADYLRLHTHTEVPDLFALWCGLSCISAVLQRRVWLDMGTYTIYPNMFVVLVAQSGRCRKSTSIDIATGLLDRLDPRLNVLPNKTTAEAIIGRLKNKPGEPAVGYLAADELSTFLNRRSYDAGIAELLIPLYDCKNRFEYETKIRGKETLEHVCLSILAGSTVEWIRNAIPPDAIGGGLTSRMIFVFVEKPPPPVAITSFDETKIHLMDKLPKELETIRLLSGAVTLTPEAWDYYSKEYNRFYDKSEFYNMPTLSGYASRRSVHMLKLSILFAAPEAIGCIVVHPRHLDGAKTLLEQVERSMPKVLMLITANEKGHVIDLVLSLIGKNGGIKRADLIHAMAHRIDMIELDRMLETLTHSNQISTDYNNKGGSVTYRLKGQRT